MSFKSKNDKGEEIEVFTAEEVAAKAKEAAEEARKNNPEAAALKADLEKKDKALKEAEELLKSGGNAAQIERLRAERDEAKKALENDLKAMREELNNFKTSSVAEVKTSLLDKFSAGNKELRSKIEYEFERYDASNNTKEGIQARMEKAATIVLGQKPTPRFLDNLSAAGGKGESGGKSGTYIPKNENEKNIGNVLGITDKDREKYGPKIK